MNTRAPVWVAVVFGALAGGCSSGPCDVEANTLEGSVSELLVIAPVDTVSALHSESDEAVTIDFKRGTDSVAKVVADVRTFAKGARIPLTDGDVFRVTSPGTDFPRDIESGNVTFDSELSVGSDVVGCFNVLFNFEDGKQRTLEGAFQTLLKAGL